MSKNNSEDATAIRPQWIISCLEFLCINRNANVKAHALDGKVNTVYKYSSLLIKTFFWCVKLNVKAPFYAK